MPSRVTTSSAKKNSWYQIGCFGEPLAVSGKYADKMLISPTNYRNPNNWIRTCFSPELSAEQ